MEKFCFIFYYLFPDSNDLVNEFGPWPNKFNRFNLFIVIFWKTDNFFNAIRQVQCWSLRLEIMNKFSFKWNKWRKPELRCGLTVIKSNRMISSVLFSWSHSLNKFHVQVFITSQNLKQCHFIECRWSHSHVRTLQRLANSEYRLFDSF